MSLKGLLIPGYVRFTALFVCLTAFSLSEVEAQSVTDKFERLNISENYDSAGTHWTIVSNAENLFIVQDGEYILQRKASSAPFAIIANFESEFSEYRAVVSMRLEKHLGENAHMGMLFMMQPQGQGGFLVEVNKKREYRLRQIVAGSYRYISGSSKDGGWVRNNAVNETGAANVLEVRTSKGEYDLYINNVYIRSFSEPNYRSGKLGLIIGPESRGKVDFFYVFTRGSVTAAAKNQAKTNNSETPANNNEPGLIELTQSIISLKTRINELEEENDGLRKTISAMKTGDQEKDVMIKNHEKQVQSLKDQITARENTIDSLNKAIAGLQQYKDLLGDNATGDVVINLSKALKAEKEKNQKLEAEIKALKAKPTAPKDSQPGPNPDKQGTSSGSQKTGTEPKKDSNVFSLPR